MSIDNKKIINEFNRIKSLGYIVSNRPKSNDGAIGNTFEDHLGVKENNKKDPDFEGFEIKSQREFTGSKVSLFTKSPTNPKKANAYLKDTFGRGDSMFPELKSLHASMFGDRWNSVYDTYKMKLLVDRNQEKVTLQIKNIAGITLSDHVYWSFDNLKKAMSKMSSLFVVIADTKIIDSQEYFHYNSAVVYHNLIFENFLDLLENGHVMFDIRIGVYKSGKKIGKPHDHGSGFRLVRSKVSQLYEKFIKIGNEEDIKEITKVTEENR